MISSALRYVVKHPDRAFGAIARNPISVWDTLHDRLVQNREYKRGPYAPDADPNWRNNLDAWLETDSSATDWEFARLWHDVVTDLEQTGIPTGPLSFNGYNDGDRAFVSAIWRLVHALRPAYVAETGVAHGFTSRFILEGLERNSHGRLYSIDRPPLDPAMQAQVGVAVGGRFAHRWNLIAGTSRRCLPGLLTRLGEIDLFIHDSLHTERNVVFELTQAWAMLRPGGAMVVDDIDSNWGFDSFAKSQKGLSLLICEAEPIRPDPRRFNAKGLFGIILKDR